MMEQDPLKREFIFEMTRLQLWHVWHTLSHESMGFAEAVTERVKIGPLYPLDGACGREPREFQLDAAPELISGMAEIFGRHRHESTSEPFERQGLDLLLPLLEPGWHVVPGPSRPTPDPLAGFGYEFRPFYPEPDSQDHLTLHFSNAFRPDSPFQHIPEMIAALKEIVKRSGGERPDVDMVQSASWLNSLPPYAQMFPPVWRDSAQVGRPGNHAGWWGQFTDRHGGFHHRNAARFRETATFPYTHVMCRCRISELKEHLETKFAAGYRSEQE